MSMVRYSLFKKLGDGSPIWICDADHLGDVVAKMRELASQSGLEHFVHDFRFGTIVATSRDVGVEDGNAAGRETSLP